MSSKNKWIVAGLVIAVVIAVGLMLFSKGPIDVKWQRFEQEDGGYSLSRLIDGECQEEIYFDKEGRIKRNWYFDSLGRIHDVHYNTDGTEKDHEVR